MQFVAEVGFTGADEEGGDAERGEWSLRWLGRAVDGEEKLGGRGDRVAGFGFDLPVQEGEEFIDDGGLLLDALVAVEVAEQAADLFAEKVGEAGGGIGFVYRVRLGGDVREGGELVAEAGGQEGVVEALAHDPTCDLARNGNNAALSSTHRSSVTRCPAGPRMRSVAPAIPAASVSAIATGVA